MAVGEVKGGFDLPDPTDPTRFKAVHLMGFLDDQSRMIAARLGATLVFVSEYSAEGDGVAERFSVPSQAREQWSGRTAA